MAWPWKFFVVSLLFPLAVCAQQPIPTPKAIQFERGKIGLGGKVLRVELAKTSAEHAHGLMFRFRLPEDEGMLFIFESEDRRSFWMKNTYIDLSIGYFNKEKVLVDIQEMKGTSVMESMPPSYPSAKPAMYALEMTKGWFTKNKIKIGDRFQFLSR